MPQSTSHPPRSVTPGGRLLAEGSAPLLPPKIADESLQILCCAPLWDKE